MARQRAPVQVNQFVGGINTESNPLTQPANASFDELNMEILLDGSRRRRRGFNVEDNHSVIDTGISTQPNQIIARSQFKWDNPGGLSGSQLLVVQVGNHLAIHDLDNDILSSSVLHSKTFPTTNYGSKFDYASVDGVLVLVTGDKDIVLFEYDGTVITESTGRLTIRDFFGVEDVVSGDDLKNSQNLNIRPGTLSDCHLYNLRNQTYALPRVTSANTVALIDPIEEFFSISGNTVYPSNADSALSFIFADANLTSNRTVDRYFEEDNFKELPGHTPAPVGYFIIDALDRGASRLAQEAALVADNPDLGLSVTSLVEDSTTGGPTSLEQYAGRVWYAGFPGQVTDGDAKSPRMSSYVLFSKLVQESNQITECVQEADPTSNIDANLVDTDGGFIKIDGAFDINSLVSLGSSLFIFAGNGIWQLVGKDRDSFTPTSYSLIKMFDEGCINGNSVVVKDDSILFWGQSDIYAITKNQAGEWQVASITETTIKTLYKEISFDDKLSAIGFYDVVDDNIRWLYGVTLNPTGQAKELILNTRYGAFLKAEVSAKDGVAGPLSVSGGQPLNLSTVNTVTVGGVVVTAGGVDVTTGTGTVSRAGVESQYCILTTTTPTISYTFGGYDEDFVGDWANLGSQIYPTCFLTTTSNTGGDGRLRKDVPYLTVYFNEDVENNDAGLENSCLVQAQWDWTTDVSTGKWSPLRQAYRPSRKGAGNTITTTRNKIRGFGRSVAFNFQAEDEKDLHIYGWEFNLAATTEE